MTLVESRSPYCIENEGAEKIAKNLADRKAALDELRERMHAVKATAQTHLVRVEALPKEKAPGIAKTSKASGVAKATKSAPAKRWSPDMPKGPPAKIPRGTVGAMMAGLGLKTVFRKI